MTNLRLCVSILAASAALGLAGCGVGEASVNEQGTTSTPVPVEVALPQRADIYATYDATTTIGSEGDAPVLARVAGEIVELLVEEGDWVSEGQVLARLDGERLRLEMLAAKADLEKARGEYERYLDLNKRGLVSEAMFEGLRYDVDALNANYKLKKLNYGYSNIRATIAGYVSDRSVKLGQNIMIDEETFRITDTGQLVAYLQIPQTELSKFAAGHAATLQVDSMPAETFPAEILRISPTIDMRNGTFRATAFIDNSEGKLAPGMFARFSIAYEKHAAALTVPAISLIEEDDETSVYVVTDGEVSRRRIEIGIVSNERVEVLDGLDDNDQIVVVGQTALRDGSKVLARLDDADNFAG
ncbi:MAG: efflux RND transporter periplasmic adaptor subunit [Gammaproteobacteria bacterium]|nr:efflux RND transporter periplasmic adaptor subunit [Gammaproteobacteria bacterium]